MKILKTIAKYYTDILIVLGLLFMNVPFYAISLFIGIGVTGIILFALGVFFILNEYKPIK